MTIQGFFCSPIHSVSHFAVVSLPCGRYCGVCHSSMVGLCLSTPHRALYYLLYGPLVLPSHLPLTGALTGLLSVSLSTVPFSRPREHDSQSMESRTRIARAHRVLLQRFHSCLRLWKGLCIPPPVLSGKGCLLSRGHKE